MKMKKEKDIETRIKSELKKIEPFLASEGGFVTYEKFEDGILYLRFGGACEDCSLIDYTLKDGIEQLICSEVPEVKEVRKV